ncbi:outer dense fiber protein 4 [Dasypus novemcinctus]|uniref:outer dense fiber protein 4 n=1 Tax=Dasypus novemcinctus TaxID=9361 RepID=UPI000328A1B1|nr:outer dense fiber protein 4 [Dasypus novemcinctus]
MDHHWVSPLLRSPSQNFHQTSQVLASELSLAALILLLVMVFSKKWLCLSRSRFYQRWPADVSTRIHRAAHVMSMGPLKICSSGSCFSVENRKDTFKEWTHQPVFEVANISFWLAVGLGFVLTIWLHLPYLPGLERWPSFDWTGIIMSVCEVTFIFSTLILFPINLWIFELKRNLSIPIGWSYFLGWLVFVLYVVCAIICYCNHSKFRSLDPNSSASESSSRSFSTTQDSLGEQNSSESSTIREETLKPEQKKMLL